MGPVADQLAKVSDEVDRIVDVFPSHQQTQIRTQLSFVLEGILCQSLLERASGKGRIMAMEVLVPNVAIRNLIREGKTHQIYTQLEAGGALGVVAASLPRHLQLAACPELVEGDLVFRPLASSPDPD